MQRGTYQIIKTDGTERTVEQKPRRDVLEKEIGASWMDTVLLDRQKQTVMLVDDTGMIDGKPVNWRATELMRRAFGDGYPNQIHGDVAIVNDADFA